MIVAGFPGNWRKEPGKSKLFRGKDLPYWIEKIFSRVEFPVERDIGKTGEFDFLFVFHPEKFPLVSPEGIEEIMSFLDTQDPGEPCLLTLEGYPLFILSFYTYKQLRLDPADETLFLKLQEHKELRPLSLEDCCRILDVHRDTLEIENRVVTLQVEMLAADGVIVEDFNHFYMEGLAQVGKGTTLSTGTVIKGDTRIGENVVLYPHTYVENSIISDNCTVLPGCILRDSELEEGVQIGPYTHLRNGALVKKGAKMGNFVEMKKSVLGEGSKAMHLTYIGDADVGKNVNIGAGTITCNYDGKNKNKTVIEDNTFIGSGTELVAPVAVRKNSYVAAGSTITEDVPPDSLGVARQKQRNILDWVKRKRG